MRILLTNTGPWGTGSFTVADALVREFAKLGHEVSLFFPDTGIPSQLIGQYYEHPDQYAIWKFPRKINGFYFPAFPLIIPDPHPRSDWHMTYKELSQEMFDAFMRETEIRLREHIDAFKPDVIECQHVWLMNYIVSQLDYPLFCTAHHSDQIGFRYDDRVQKYALDSLQKTEKVFAISDYVKKEIMKLYGLAEEKISVFRNGYDETIFYPQEEDKAAVLSELGLNADPKKTYVSFAGKISKTKGIDVLLKANALMNRDDIEFLILGGGDHEKFINEMFNEGINTSGIHFVGHLPPEQVAKVHNISKLSVLPSRTEGFGIACLEAMACGLPLVVTKLGGLPEFAVGSFIKCEDAKELAKEIEAIVDMPDPAYHKLSDEAVRRAAHFSWEDIAKRRVEQYEEVVAKRMRHSG